MAQSKPTFERDPETGEIREFRPVAVKREELEAESIEADKAVAAADLAVKAQSDAREGLAAQLDEATENLNKLLTEQEAKREAAAFRKAKLVAYDEVSAANPAPVNETSSPVIEDAPAAPVPGQPSAEEVAESLDLEADPAEPVAESEEVILPVRRRAAV